MRQLAAGLLCVLLLTLHAAHGVGAQPAAPGQVAESMRAALLQAQS